MKKSFITSGPGYDVVLYRSTNVLWSQQLKGVRVIQKNILSRSDKRPLMDCFSNYKVSRLIRFLKM